LIEEPKISLGKIIGEEFIVTEQQVSEKVENSIISLINSYQQEVAEYQELLKLTKNQQEFIKSNEWDNFNLTRQKKRDLMLRIDRLEGEILRFEEQISSELDLELREEFYPNLIKMELPKTKELYQVLQQIHTIMDQINKLNDKNQAQIEAGKQQKQQRLDEINRGKDANSNNAYSEYFDN
jgi:wyosine [tRNA(Phe)-imidazoG37] synthetase (radical SAM superfamily)